MTGPLRVSIIVVSRGRPALLARCLAGISQLWHDAFEVVVVADPAGCAAVDAWADRIKCVPFDEPNISSARNLGIQHAAGEIVAFIDDDAVPEPSWLSFLTAPFDDPEVVQTGGYVRGRNGISFQWRGRVVDRTGVARPLVEKGDLPYQPRVGGGEAAKTEGTNMALRRNVIAGIGGFDPAFRFFLDETDVNLRLADARTMLVPLAQVHHGFAASPTRKAGRAPLDLSEIAASSAVFLRKHAPDLIDFGRNRAFLEQRSRLIRYLNDGRLEPRDVGRLMRGFERGFADGLSRVLSDLVPIKAASAPFLPFDTSATGSSTLIAGRRWSRSDLEAQARERVARGEVITVLELSATARPHQVKFHSDGFWEQRGGVFGPSDRADPLVCATSFARRVARERAMIGQVRGF
ncbi:glycosyltransferase family 2 protein [Maritimibacter dapengensis]|uniref:Glycosyltransferase family 2 protein n=1 Tax=Maritimibacter dapengensis TaxID=2836868 RepID=A0ABS6T4F2_9RHOB|nr:glycosyltransferase family 2 protein [Maritimibacter dapengensis]MBV7380121.1 glycosyltransferase family 2 protein [Maritimibacter dapengensis]